MKVIAAWIIALLVVAACLLLGRLGWVEVSVLFDLGMTMIALAGLVSIVKLPWDLYFDARALVIEQKESKAAGLTVADDDQTYAKQVAKRMLIVCLGIHLVTALLVSAATYYSKGVLGYYFAGFFLLSMAFRPMLAAYGHLRRRLLELHGRCRFPRDDVLDLKRRLRELEEGRVMTRRNLESLTTRIDEFEASLGGRVTSLEGQARDLSESTDDRFRETERELQRSLERLTEDKELIGGMKALVRMVKST